MLKAFVILAFVILSCQGELKDTLPGHYKVHLAKATHLNKKQKLVVVRSFITNGKSKLLVIDPDSLTTSIVDKSDYNETELTWDQLKKEFKDSNYIKLFDSAQKNSENLMDAGITHVMPDQKGIDLTIDLCPSHRPLDKKIFTSIIAAFGKKESPVPLAISVSGIWIEKHQKDLEWLKSLVKDKKVKIEWINHSFHHRVSTSEPLKENFLLEKGTNINDEILETERLMIAHGLLPSFMFRFPGLISDKSLYEKVMSYGLLPIGSDAWLAKGEKAYNGSIVLVHGNGNEPLGIHDFLELVREEGTNIHNQDWLLFDLRESFIKEEK